MNYAVYLHRRLDTNEVFYVGKAKKICRGYPRSKAKDNRNNHWKNVANKAGFSVELCFTDLSNEEACAKEILLIKFHGSKSELTNYATGGEGPFGVKQSEDRVNSRAEATKSYWASAEGLAQKKAQLQGTLAKAKEKPILCTTTGVNYKSTKEASEVLNIPRRCISNVLRGESMTAYGLNFTFIPKEV